MTEHFSISGIPNALGIRYAGVGWTWLQAPGFGYQCDSVWVLRAEYLVTIAECGLLPSDSHADVIALAGAVAALPRDAG